MLAYGGFRPIEDRNAEWRDVHKDAMRVYATKTRRERYVDLLAPLAEDLAEWRVACKGGTDGLIIPRPSGGSWSREDWANWRRRVYQPAALAAGVTGDLRPYRLRGSFVSLLLWSGEYCCGRARISCMSPIRPATRSRRWRATTPVSSVSFETSRRCPPRS